jgi:hypothetical protein
LSTFGIDAAWMAASIPKVPRRLPPAIAASSRVRCALKESPAGTDGSRRTRAACWGRGDRPCSSAARFARTAPRSRAPAARRTRAPVGGGLAVQFRGTAFVRARRPRPGRRQPGSPSLGPRREQGGQTVVQNRSDAYAPSLLILGAGRKRIGSTGRVWTPRARLLFEKQGVGWTCFRSVVMTGSRVSRRPCELVRTTRNGKRSSVAVARQPINKIWSVARRTNGTP